MEKMFAQMLKAAGLDPDALQAFIVEANTGLKGFVAAFDRVEKSLARIEENQAQILARLDWLEEIDSRTNDAVRRRNAL